MNWDAVSFDWNQVRAFLATAEEGSFSGAARALKTTQPTVGRQIAALEESLGLTLVERSGRLLALTEPGRDLLDHVHKMGEAAAQISMIAEGQSTQATGKVTITATDLLSAMHMPEMLAPLRESAPGISLHLVCSNDLSDLMRREADIAIRHVRPDQPELIARHIGDFQANLYAAPTYLDAVGRPTTLRDIARMAMVGVADADRIATPLQQMGIPVTEENFMTSSDSGVVIWHLVKAGFGASILPEFHCDREPGFEKVFPALPSLQFPVWLVTHRELKTSRRIRIVFDALAERLAKAVLTNSASKG
ncbi:MAG: LysR family transcriptional regulator [Erythrobacter sp.]